MLLAVDIGNSSIKFGVFEAEHLVDKFSVPTIREYAVEELQFDRLKHARDRFLNIDTVLICSVVPELDATLSEALAEQLMVTPIFVDHTFDLGMTVDYDPPSDAGIDRLVNASAAGARLDPPFLVCSFGTATTIDAVGPGGRFLGGAIAPGMKLMAGSLKSGTSRLPLVSVGNPTSVLGNTTEGSIRSGVFYGYIGLVEGLIRRSSAAIGGDPKVIGTGGFGHVILQNSDVLDDFDEDLTLKGLQRLASRRS